MQWPLENPQITQLFGANPDDYKQFGMPGHNGLDVWTGSKPPEIKPVIRSIVISAGWDQYGYGKLVVCEYKGVRFYYAHLSEVLCAPGDELDETDILGIMGSTGNSTGPHLHLGFRKGTGGIYRGFFDPLPYLQGIADLELEYVDNAPKITPLKPAGTGVIPNVPVSTPVKTRGKKTIFKRIKYF